VASYDAAVTRRLGGRGNAMGGVVGEVGDCALDDALAACMFGGMRQCSVVMEEGGSAMDNVRVWVEGRGISGGRGGASGDVVREEGGNDIGVMGRCI
jgi:hypothetical protein